MTDPDRPQVPRRKLIEVALPLEAVNAAGRAEKAVPKKGHPATMHLWWSRKPLGVTRAVLFASLVDDPSARLDLYPTEADQDAERRRLFTLIEALCRWERSGDTALVAEAQRCIENSSAGDPPRIIDPFCGGGAIPTEALRLGLDTLAIDLNPVAALVSAATLSIAQRFAGRPAVRAGGPEDGDGPAGIAADVARYGAAVEAECRRRLAGAFEPLPSPLSPDGRTVAISYLWARTIPCASPACRRSTPLLSTWWLSRKPTNRWHARPVLEGDSFGFEVEPGAPPADLVDLKVGRGTNFRCLFCGNVNDADWVRRCGLESVIGLRLVAVQAFSDPRHPRDGRIWLAPDAAGERAGLARCGGGLPAPVEAALQRELPPESGNVTAFGIRTFGDLLSPRQCHTLATFSEVIAEATPAVQRDALAAGMTDDGVGIEQAGHGALAYAEAVTTYLALALSRLANRTTTMTTHNRANGSVEQSFIRPSYGFYGEFPEANPFSGSTGSWAGGLDYVVRALEALPAPASAPSGRHGGTAPAPDLSGGSRPARPRVGQADVRCGSMLVALDGESGVVCTDPPYYDMFDYASLSNLFLVWLRATLGGIWPETLGALPAPTDSQIVSNAARCNGDRSMAHDRFESLLRSALARIREVHDPRYPLALFYGYQQAGTGSRNGRAGAWGAMLESLIGAGLRISATWPLRTERPEGVKKGTRSLATSLLLICRPVEDDRVPRPTATARDFRRALRDEVPVALSLLQRSNIAPLDLGQAVIGTGMRVFTGCAGVLAPDGSRLGVAEALEVIDEVLDESLAELDAELDAQTRWALTWFDEHAFTEGPLSRAERRAGACGTSVADLIDARIVAAADGRVRLLAGEELEAARERTGGGHLTVWEATQHLLRCLLDGGEPAAAALLSRLDSDAAGGTRHLAYRLYRICNRHNRAAEATACNRLVASWSELSRGAPARSSRP